MVSETISIVTLWQYMRVCELEAMAQKYFALIDVVLSKMVTSHGKQFNEGIWRS